VARYAYERLSAQDATFLWAERENAPMHVGAVAILETGPLRNADGGVDFARYRSAIESVLHWIPRYRQKLAWTPLEGWPVWIDDRHFDIGYHLRHLSLARPGTLAQLRELASRILARPLDRSRPLWEIWVIEGLEGGEQFALLNKVHHCMINTIVTNISGPRFPLYVVGAPLLGLYPVVPLLPGVGLGIALFSYDGKLCWGFNADYELVPDLRVFHDDVCAAFEELRRSAVARYMKSRTGPAEREIEVPVAEARPKPRRRKIAGGPSGGGEALAAQGSGS